MSKKGGGQCQAKKTQVGKKFSVDEKLRWISMKIKYFKTSIWNKDNLESISNALQVPRKQKTESRKEKAESRVQHKQKITQKEQIEKKGHTQHPHAGKL